MKKIVFPCLPLIVVAILVTAVRCADNKPGETTDRNPPISTVPTINHVVVNRFAHDTSFFTEGLEFYKGQLWESSGGDNEASFFPSAAGILDLKTGKVDVKIRLDKNKYFGEGITFFNDKLYFLTWKSGIGFIYDVNTFKKLQEFPIPAKEGWGLTHDSANLIMSDGSSNLYFLTPDSLKLMKIVSVSDNNGPIPNINELEYVDGFIFANQWLTPYIYKIDAESGKVVGRIDLTNVAPEIKAEDLDPNWNGIAYDSATKKMYVTSKKWRYIYELTLP